MKKNKYGFTIVELLIVIVVIGILAALVISAYGNVTKRAVAASLQSDLHNSAKQLKAYHAANGAYPAAIDDCPTPSSGNVCLRASSNNTYTYAYDNSSSPKTFSLKAVNGSVAYEVTQSNSEPQAASPQSSGSESFTYTGSAQTWTVPSGVQSVQIETWGAQGGGSGGATGAKGGYAKGTLTVTPGETLSIYVGGAGKGGSSSAQAAGGWNGGGYAWQYDGSSYGAGGGGATDVRQGGSALANRKIVAGGGGGSGAYSGTHAGGVGGGTNGSVGQTSGSYTGGGGGSQSSGGSAGTSSSYSQAGSIGQGGNQTGSSGGWTACGGGGGYYGGGSGGALGAGGGGGSSYIDGVSGGSTQAGVRIGDGQVTITW